MANKSEYDAYLREAAKYLLSRVGLRGDAVEDADEDILKAHEEGIIGSSDPHSYRLSALANSYAKLLVATEYDPGLYGVVRGSVMTGFEIYGPFLSVEQAADWAQERTIFLGPVTVMPIRPPDSCGTRINKEVLKDAMDRNPRPRPGSGL